MGAGILRDHSGVSHSLVVHELWVLVVGGSNPSTPSCVWIAEPEPPNANHERP